MADRVVTVLTEADSYDLISLDDLKVLLGVLPTDASQDEILNMYIDNYSDVVATFCNRVFGYEEVQEVWRCVDYDQTNSMKRLFMSHYPIDVTQMISVESPVGSVLDPLTYVIEEKSGKIELLSMNDEPIMVKYWGGYKLPTDSPPALKQAIAFMVREGQAHMQRFAVSGIRSISHKDARVMYFDVNATIAKQQGGPGVVSPVANSLLMKYVRHEV